MDCFNKLTNSQFLKHLEKEIKVAQSTFSRLTEDCPPLGELVFNNKLKRYKYDCYLNLCGFKEEFLFMDANDKHALYYMSDSGILLVCARSKKALETSIRYTLHTSGDIPFYRTKHYIQNRVFYTAMYDLMIQLVPPTTN